MIDPKIKEAVLANHGGFDGASDAQIMTIWHSLEPAVQQRYLKPQPKSKGTEDAASA